MSLRPLVNVFIPENPIYRDLLAQEKEISPKEWVKDQSLCRLLANRRGRCRISRFPTFCTDTGGEGCQDFCTDLRLGDAKRKYK